LRKYETLFITDSNLAADGIKEVKSKFENIITESKGLLIKWEDWGQVKLAYNIKKKSHGIYLLMIYAGDSGLVSELERNMRIDDRILKYLTSKLDDHFDPASLNQEKTGSEKNTLEEVDHNEKTQYAHVSDNPETEDVESD